MGWTGIWKDYDKNIECIKHSVLYGKTEDERFWYRGISQKGSSVYVLYQSKKNNVHFVICYLCQTTRCHGYREFMYKDIDAVSNLCYDFPKKWVALLDKSDPDVQKYIEGRTAYEQKKKTAYTPKLNDLFKCTSSYPLSWNGFTIDAGKEFYVKYYDWYGHKYFLLADANGHIHSNRITRKRFNSLKTKELVNESN